MKKKKRRSKSIFLIFLTIIVFAAIGMAGYFYYFISKLNDNSVKNSNVTAVKPESNAPVNILIMGVDIGTVGAKASNNQTRSDTMMIYNYDPETKKVNIVSVPRDTLVKYKGRSHKINEVHALGGTYESIKAVESLLNININYYGKLNYSAFRKVIDSLGGIDMEITQNMNYDDASQNLHIHFKKGETVHLNGEKAEEFFRWRKNNDGTGIATGDLGRIDNQHLFMQKVFDKFKSPAVIVKLPSILSTVSSDAETNIDGESLLKYGYDFAKIPKEDVNITTLKGQAKYISGVSYFIYSKKENSDLLGSFK